MAPTNNKMQMAVITPSPAEIAPVAALALVISKTCEKSSEPKVVKIKKMPSVKPKSPTRLTTKAFLPASAALFLWKKNPIRR